MIVLLKFFCVCFFGFLFAGWMLHTLVARLWFPAP